MFRPLIAGGRQLWTAALFVCVLTAAAEPRAQPVHILHHERLAGDSLSGFGSARPERGPPAERRLPAERPRLSFVAFGRAFDTVLERSDRVLNRLAHPRRDDAPPVELYRGVLEGVEGSWLRLARYEDELSGLIWDGRDAYFIEPYSRVAALLATPDERASDEPVIFRWSETVGVLVDHVMFPTGSTEHEALGMEALASWSLQQFSTSIQQLDIGLIGDREFAEREGTQAEAVLVAMAHIVDGIFAEQLGIHLNVAEIDLHGADSTVFTTNDPVGLLRQVEQRKASVPALAAQGLAHLFTGRTLSGLGPDNMRTVGVANLGTVCSERYGVALTDASLGISVSGLVAAHEIGHNFGAPHDAEPGPCASTPDTYLMAPRMNGMGVFSQCSIEQMRPQIEAATCLAPVASTDLAVRGVVGSSELSLESTIDLFEFAIDNLGSMDAFHVEVSIDIEGAEIAELSSNLPELQCDPLGSPTPLRCTLFRLPAGASRVVRMYADATHVGPGWLELGVSALNDANPANDTHRFEFEVEPAISVAFNIEQSVASPLRPGDTATAVMSVRNRGRLAATNASIELGFPEVHLDFLEAHMDGVPCHHVEHGRGRCSIGTFAAGEQRTVSLQVRVKEDAPAPRYHTHTGVQFSVLADQRISSGIASRGIGFWIARWVADLELEISGPATAQVGSSVQFGVTMRNNGPDTLDGGRFNFGSALIGNFIVHGYETADPVRCTIGLSRLSVDCDADPLPVGGSVSVTFGGEVPTAGAFRVSARGGSFTYDANDENGYVHHEFTVTELAVSEPPPPPPLAAGGGNAPAPPSSGAGGGGGSADPGSLLLLLALVLAGLTLGPTRRTGFAVRVAIHEEFLAEIRRGQAALACAAMRRYILGRLPLKGARRWPPPREMSKCSSPPSARRASLTASR